MKSSPSELKKLRARAKLEQAELEGDVKHLGTHETSQQRKFIKIVIWVIAIAFASTTFLGLFLGFFMKDSSQTNQKQTNQKPLSAEERERKMNEANVEYYKKQVTETPTDANSWNNLASAYFYMEKYPESIDAYKKAIELEPKNTIPMKRLAVVYASQKQYDEAKKMLEAALPLEDDANKQTVYELMARVSFESENIDDAIGNMKKAIEHDKGQPKYYVALTQFYMKKKDNENAKKTIEEGTVIAKAMGDQQSEMILKLYKDTIDKPKGTPGQGGMSAEELERLVKEGTDAPSPEAGQTAPAPAPEATATENKGEATETPAAPAAPVAPEVKPEENKSETDTAPAPDANTAAPAENAPAPPPAPATDEPAKSDDAIPMPK